MGYYGESSCRCSPIGTIRSAMGASILDFNSPVAILNYSPDVLSNPEVIHTFSGKGSIRAIRSRQHPDHPEKPHRVAIIGLQMSHALAVLCGMSKIRRFDLRIMPGMCKIGKLGCLNLRDQGLYRAFGRRM